MNLEIIFAYGFFCVIDPSAVDDCVLARASRRDWAEKSRESLLAWADEYGPRWQEWIEDWQER